MEGNNFDLMAVFKSVALAVRGEERHQLYASKSSYKVEQRFMLALFNIPWGVLPVNAVFVWSN